VPTNDLWHDVPDRNGYWWAVNPDPAFAHDYCIGQAFYEGGLQNPRLLVWLAGEHKAYPAGHWKGFLVWQKAILPIYSWPSP
jgi:hypothetical protein